MAYNDPKYDERKYVEEIVKEMDCDSRFLYFKPEDVITYIQDAIHAQDEPFGGVQTISYLRLMHLAKNKAKTTVLLEGQGGDELFAGYDNFRGAYYKDILSHFHLYTFLKEIYHYKKIKRYTLIDLLKSIRNAITSQKGGTTQDAIKSTNISCINSNFLKQYQKKTPTFTKPFTLELTNQQ